jgi:hypothetical protein
MKSMTKKKVLKDSKPSVNKKPMPKVQVKKLVRKKSC